MRAVTVRCIGGGPSKEEPTAEHENFSRLAQKLGMRVRDA